MSLVVGILVNHLGFRGFFSPYQKRVPKTHVKNFQEHNQLVMEAGHFLNGRRAKGPLHTYDLLFIVHASRIFMLQVGSEFMIYIVDPSQQFFWVKYCE